MALGASASLQAVADWLEHTVGVGGTFTMLELRDAVPDANQVDRRMRDLRQMDPPWVIASAQSDPSLSLNQYRLDVVGGMVRAKLPSSKTRRQVFEAADHCCQVCGIGLGEEYAEYPGERARMQLGHWVPLDQGGSSTRASNLRAECHRCNGGIRHLTGAAPTPQSVAARAKALSRGRREDLLRWMDQGRRDVDAVETVYYELRSLPAAARDEILAALRQTI
jgi:hypothetical protein